MRKTILIFLIILCGCNLYAQPQTLSTKPLVIGEIRTIKSEVLNEDRILNIYLPGNYDTAKAYPVIYLLDGTINEDFLHIVGLVQFFNLQFQMPDIIIVGIANVDRKRDFTFHTDLEDLQKDFPTTGHSDVFIKFIEEELQPFISNTYKTDGIKYIIGQSLAGLLASEILLKKPDLFTHYIIVSPSLWWDNESMLENANALLENQSENKLYVYIAVGTGEEKIMIRDASGLKKALEKSGNKNLTIEYNLMANENHATILHNAIYDALLNLYPYKE
ncbi:MAG: alpha/beta hydrolase [Bacteroidetes bacterium]|nr:alpha/beta hydrolase [Bacteroidota bacterium]MBP7399083.1 alpha/beta hydrolase [Chitinophagales bacterium]MBK7110218.1 alpha/beta hydrolase [Bacteroidota bacterium]MBK8680439.1 alpha/beta hydrolase [Bacteroidota bacterium]MBP8754044.1 alpha/beta hydrolase [Chitinophagales bacterium]